METVSIKINGDSAAVDEAVRVLKNGGVVVIPTDTVYGLAADAGNEKAVKKVFEIKSRPEDKKLPVFVSSFEMLDKIADFGQNRVLTSEPGSDQPIFEFLKKVWSARLRSKASARQGKITCVLPAKGDTLEKVSPLGVRMPNYDLILKIIEKFGRPITGTSANVSGGKEHTKINELIEEFENTKVKPDLILDAGDLPESKPSTVLDCTVWPPKILREGAVSKEELDGFLK